MSQLDSKRKCSTIFFSNVHLNKAGPYLVLVCPLIFAHPCKAQGKNSLNIYIYIYIYIRRYLFIYQFLDALHLS